MLVLETSVLIVSQHLHVPVSTAVDNLRTGNSLLFLYDIGQTVGNPALKLTNKIYSQCRMGAPNMPSIMLS